MKMKWDLVKPVCLLFLKYLNVSTHMHCRLSPFTCHSHLIRKVWFNKCLCTIAKYGLAFINSCWHYEVYKSLAGLVIYLFLNAQIQLSDNNCKLFNICGALTYMESVSLIEFICFFTSKIVANEINDFTAYK